MREQFKNSAATTLTASAITSTQTTITVVDATQLPSSPQFRIKIDSELLLVVGISGNTLTVVRGAEGTTAASHGGTSDVTHVLTQASLQTYGRDNVPWFDGIRQPFQLLDASGNTLTSSSFTEYRTASDVGTPVISDQDRAITIKRPAGSQGPSSTEGLVSLGRAVSSPYSVTLALAALVTGASGDFSIYVGARESASGKSKVLRLPFWYSGVNEWSINTYVNEASAGFVANKNYPVLRDVMWFRVRDDSTDLYFDYGDGVNWQNLYSAARAANFTTAADTVIFGAGANNNSFDDFLTLMAWSGA